MSRRLGKLIILGFVLVVGLGGLLASCRNETQNRLRRNIQDFTGGRMYITLYTLDGVPIFEGVVDGKVTRSSETLSGNQGQAAGSYVFWYDHRGRYHQSSLPYLVTSYDRNDETDAE